MGEFTPFFTKHYKWVSGVEKTRLLALRNYWIVLLPLKVVMQHSSLTFIVKLFEQNLPTDFKFDKADHLNLLKIERCVLRTLSNMLDRDFYKNCERLSTFFENPSIWDVWRSSQ